MGGRCRWEGEARLWHRGTYAAPRVIQHTTSKDRVYPRAPASSQPGVGEYTAKIYQPAGLRPSLGARTRQAGACLQRLDAEALRSHRAGAHERKRAREAPANERTSGRDRACVCACCDARRACACVEVIFTVFSRSYVPFSPPREAVFCSILMTATVSFPI
jgi:hypothetical protein